MNKVGDGDSEEDASMALFDYVVDREEGSKFLVKMRHGIAWRGEGGTVKFNVYNGAWFRASG